MEISGYLLIDKPSNISSHGVINQLRRLTGIARIGHSGTLDPLATGLMICAVSRQATKTLDRYLKLAKVYEVTGLLGAVSDTYDRQGVIVSQASTKVTETTFREAVLSFKGEQEQVPPMHSAKQVGGQRLYELARRGIEIKREPQKIVVSEIEVLTYHWPEFQLRIACSSGTYIRSIVHDLGQRLGTGAYMTELVRTQIGPLSLTQAVALNKLSQANWQTYLKPVLNI